MTTPVAGRSDGGAGLPAPAPMSGDRLQGGGASGRLRQFAWASVPIWSLSLLAFAPFLRLAAARRRARDWAVFTVYLAASILVLVLMSIAGPGDNDPVSVTAGTLAIVLMGAGAVHAFVAFRPAPGDRGSLASEQALATARARMGRRQQARELAQHNPVLARDLKIGRPDVPHDYDDGGLIDVNHVPGDVLVSALGLTPAESAAVIAARDQLGRFGSPEELSAYAQLPPDRVEVLRDWIPFS
jgi:DNA uptake protein ComE-like DNA-binding protein